MKRLLLFAFVVCVNFAHATIFTSVQNGDFYTPSTWDQNSVPSSTDSILVKHLVTSSSIEIKHLEIQKPGYLSVDNITIDEHVVTDTLLQLQTLEFIKSKSDPNIYGGVLIKDWLDINNNQVTIVDSLILESTESQTANILEISGNGQLNGTVIVRRHILNSNRIWRYLSSPIQGSTLSDWQQEIPISGNFTNADTCCGIHAGSYPSGYSYDETYLNNKENGWVALSGGSTENFNLNTGQGYVLFVRDNAERKSYFDTRGTVNQGTIDIPLSYTESDSIENDGWNLVGNPYPCKLDWDKVTALQRRNISTAIWWNDNSSGTIVQRVYSNGVGIPASTTGIIGHSQAFWIKATKKSPTLYFEELDKADATSPETYYRTSQVSDILRFKLRNQNDVVFDETVIAFDDSSSVYYDDYDAPKLDGNNIIYSLTSNGHRTAINFVPDFDTIEIQIKVDIDDAPFTLDLPTNNEYSILDSNLSPYIEGSLITDTLIRVFVIRDMIITSDVDREFTEAEIYPNPTNDLLHINNINEINSIKIYNSIGKVYFEKTENFKHSIETINMKHYPSGQYFIQVDENIYHVFKS